MRVGGKTGSINLATVGDGRYPVKKWQERAAFNMLRWKELSDGNGDDDGVDG